jgi:hypothetical protein
MFWFWFLIKLLIFAYAVGVLGAVVATLSMIYRFKCETKGIFLLVLFCFVPGINHALMWEAFKEYDSWVHCEERRWEDHKRRMGQVNHGKGLTNG